MLIWTGDMCGNRYGYGGNYTWRRARGQSGGAWGKARELGLRCGCDGVIMPLRERGGRRELVIGGRVMLELTGIHRIATKA